MIFGNLGITPRDGCVEIQIGAATPARTALFTASNCPGETARDIDVHDYMTDGSGSGSVQLKLDADGVRTIEVEREGETWHVLRVR